MSVKKYTIEMVIMSVQLFMFYIFPLFAGPTDAMGMVFLIMAATLALSLVLGIISDKWIKYAYPLGAAIFFVPSVFVYYNETAMIHAVWYLVISTAGLIAGMAVRRLLSLRS